MSQYLTTQRTSGMPSSRPSAQRYSSGTVIGETNNNFFQSLLLQCYTLTYHIQKGKTNYNERTPIPCAPFIEAYSKERNHLNFSNSYISR